MRYTHKQPLPTCQLMPRAVLVNSKSFPEITHPEDLALDVMVDFRQQTPPTISHKANIDSAQQHMSGVALHVLLVTDTTGDITGLICSEDLIGDKPVRITQEKRISRQDILVDMVMLPKNQVVCFKLSDLKFAKVWEVLETLRHLQQHNALILDDEDDSDTPVIIGLFSSIQIGKLLDSNVTTDISIAHSISELKDHRK